jgi:hypothetical protein
VSSNPGETLSAVGTPKIRDWRDDLVLYALPLIFFASITRTGTVMVDGDTYLHIATGRWIIEHARFVRTDFFSYTFAGARWDDPEWLSEVAMAAAYMLAGWSGIALLFSVAFGLTAFLIARQLLKYVSPLSAAIVLELSLACIANGQSSRPYALALPILAVWTTSLVAARAENRVPPLWLLPLMTLWSNLHGSFLLGIALVAFFATEVLFSATRDKWSVLRGWLLFVAGAIAAAAINPHGIWGLVGPIVFMWRPIVAGMLDWAGTTFSRVVPFELCLLALVGVCIVRPIRMPPLRLLLLLALIHMALLHRRHINVFAVVAPVVLAEPLSHAFARDIAHGAVSRATLGRLAGAVTLTLSLMIAMVRLASPNPQVNLFSPDEALSRVPARIAALPVFNEDVLGGFLIWHGIKPFIDSRQEMVTDAFFENYSRMCDPDRDTIVRTFARYNIQWTILLPTNPANAVLDSLPGWRVLYADPSAVVHVRLRPDAARFPNE